MTVTFRPAGAKATPTAEPAARGVRATTVLLAALTVLAACASDPPPLVVSTLPPAAPPPYTVTPLAEPAACDGGFGAIDLEHRIEWLGGRITNFDTIGSGLAVGDLDNDGDLDLVLANLARPSTVYWNEGGMRFRAEPLATGAARAVNAIDFDGDGWLDLAFTHPGAPPSLWLSLGAAGPGAAAYDRYHRVARLGAGYIANAMGWGDLDGDGDLDLVTGSYNSELPDLGGGFALGGGVAYYENRDGSLHLTLLGKTAEALAVLLTDLNGDRLPDIIIGNDYDHPDQVFLRAPDAEHGWREAAPFRATATNTMSYDAGDIDNDGRDELFVADMKPYRRDPEVSYAWERITILPPPDDVQANENVLLLPEPDAGAGGAVAFDNAAPERGVDATGWTWSAKFGDLDSDGFLDLYAVNGMIDALVFGHLPDDELVEQNQALRNRGDGSFAPAPEWRLGSERSGRGMSMADLDGDGDLDVVVSNMREPSQVFENRVCGGANLLVDLRQPGTGNTHAIGAQVRLVGELGGAPLQLTREVRSQSGYFSGDTSRLHFGVPRGATLIRLEIRWPDGTRSLIPAPTAGTLIAAIHPAPR
ncbi:MAG: CRTAC1 family protein [Spirochaetaceae bacterium]|nr:CRTAC1 family protein [Spirochaetaceae bacterium]